MMNGNVWASSRVTGYDVTAWYVTLSDRRHARENCMKKMMKHLDERWTTHNRKFITHHVSSYICNQARNARKSGWALSWRCLCAFCYEQRIAKYRGNVQCPDCTGDDTHLFWESSAYKTIIYVISQHEKPCTSHRSMNLDRLQECHRPVKAVWHQTHGF